MPISYLLYEQNKKLWFVYLALIDIESINPRRCVGRTYVMNDSTYASNLIYNKGLKKPSDTQKNVENHAQMSMITVVG